MCSLRVEDWAKAAAWNHVEIVDEIKEKIKTKSIQLQKVFRISINVVNLELESLNKKFQLPLEQILQT